MTAIATSGYRVEQVGRHVPFPYAVMLPDLRVRVDRFRTESAARYAARLLNDGLATVNPHAVVGCRVEVQR